MAEALSKPTQTYLVDVGTGDEGIAALASVIYQGGFQHLKMFLISDNHGISDEGIIALADAIEACGLPKLTLFEAKGLDKVTAVGFSDIARCVVKRCPKLKHIDVKGTGIVDNLISNNMIQCMLNDAGRKSKVKVNIDAWI